MKKVDEGRLFASTELAIAVSKKIKEEEVGDHNFTKALKLVMDKIDYKKETFITDGVAMFLEIIAGIDEREDILYSAEDSISSEIGNQVREKRKFVAKQEGKEWTSSEFDDKIDFFTSTLATGYEKREIDEATSNTYKVLDFFQIFQYRDSVIRAVENNECDDILEDSIPYKPMKAFAEDFVRSEIEDGEIYDIAEDYGEPGYSKESSEYPILFADWNNYPSSVVSMLEDVGYSIEWSDEWFVYYEESLAYRTSPDSYGWEPSYFMGNAELLPIEFHEEEYVEEYTNTIDKAIRSSIDLSKYGFRDIEEVCHEHGWYGRVETPKEVLEDARMLSDFDDYIFQICSVGQFAVNFKLLVRTNNDEEES